MLIVTNKSHVACVWFMRVLFAPASKNVHAVLVVLTTALI